MQPQYCALRCFPWFGTVKWYFLYHQQIKPGNKSIWSFHLQGGDSAWGTLQPLCPWPLTQLYFRDTLKIWPLSFNQHNWTKTGTLLSWSDTPASPAPGCLLWTANAECWESRISAPGENPAPGAAIFPFSIGQEFTTTATENHSVICSCF